MNEELEIKMAYLEDEVNTLNSIVTKQELLVAQLEKKVKELTQRLEEVEGENRPDRRPPHY